jgi:WD40 repeat protein
MLIKLVVMAMYIALTHSTDTVTLNDYQTNITVGDGVNASPVRVSSYDDNGSNFVTGANKYLTFYTLIGGYYSNPYNFTFNNTVIDAKLRADGLLVAAIDDTTNTVYILSKNITTSQYAINQTFDAGSHPNTLVWVNDGDTLAVGLANGNIRFYNFYFPNVYLGTEMKSVHPSGVAKIDGKSSRVVSCGRTDSNVVVSFHNLTIDTWSQNMTFLNAVTNCTAIAMAPTEQRFAIGQFNGVILLSNQNGAYFFSAPSSLAVGHTAAVNALIWSNDGTYLISGGASPDNTVHLYTKANNFTVPINTTISAQSIGGNTKYYNELAIGTFGSTSGQNLIVKMIATTCDTNSTSTSTTNTSQCNCTAPSIWANGNCITLTNAICLTFANSSVNTTNSSRCNCSTGYLWNDTLLTCQVDCSLATTNSSGVNF